MSRLRTVRLPADVPVSAISVEGDQSNIRRNEDGTTTVEYRGLLVIDGRHILSPGQLLALWSGRALVELELGDTTLRPDDDMAVSDKARLSAYMVGADTGRKVRELGHPDAKTLPVLQMMREKTAADGAAQAQTADHRAYLTEVDKVFEEMIDAWQQAIALKWMNDD
ncbi:hypothetical protein [Streptomyces sp. NPDC059649]|uniref:hypothetical protein n=1 Tax=Streptomyces sp. NPDC059649 TaxID=3346895 RepID=UPI00369DFF72